MDPKISRREALTTTRTQLAGWIFTPLEIKSWLPRLAFFNQAPDGPSANVLVCIFLRGGMDGLKIWLEKRVLLAFDVHNHKSAPRVMQCQCQIAGITPAANFDAISEAV